MLRVPYSPDVTSYHFWLFPTLKQTLWSLHFSSTAKIQRPCETEPNRIRKTEFEEIFGKRVEPMQTFLNINGRYFEKGKIDEWIFSNFSDHFLGLLHLVRGLTNTFHEKCSHTALKWGSALKFLEIPLKTPGYTFLSVAVRFVAYHPRRGTSPSYLGSPYVYEIAYSIPRKYVIQPNRQ